MIRLIGTTLLAIACAVEFTASAAGRGQMPDLDLGGVLHQERAIQALGDHLPAVAEAHGLSPEHFKEALRKDSSAKLDRHARMFYTDPDIATAGAGTPEGSTATVAGAYSVDQTFKLHSRPGASLTIYLDFDGHYLAGSGWNSSYNGGQPINCPPWDIDGNPSTFGTEECTRIQKIWQRVAEDYAPFNVDVTTEYPGEAALTRSSSSDTIYGMRVLVSPIASYFGQYGGIAYVGVFSQVGDTYKPALVFPEMLANSEKYIAEACSHECGHTLGLSHDGIQNGDAYFTGYGSGETGWAPIMGAGYYQNLTQWSKGGYTGANNSQDDLSIINGYLPYRTDDYGSDHSTSTVLPSGTQFSLDGTIERNTDADVFRFTAGAGAVTASVTPALLGPNLDITVQLRDGNDNVLASANPGDLLGASLNVAVNSGTYYLRITGSAKTDPYGYPLYASLGAYHLDLSVPASLGNTPPVAVAGADKLTGPAPLTINFTSTGSSDPEGSALTYVWNFGDGNSSTAANPTHSYAGAGTYNVTLVVRDAAGATDDATLVVTVTVPNAAPVAVAQVSSTTGTAPLTVSFNGASSYDPDGQITSYTWNFGDGTSGSGAAVAHTYTRAGTYNATLTVSDGKASSSSTVQITVSAAPVVEMIVRSITMTSANRTVNVVVLISDRSGNAVPGATVQGTWGGVVSGSASATTSSNGQASFAPKRSKKSGTATFTVTNVSKTGYVYASAYNVVTRAEVQASATP